MSTSNKWAVGPPANLKLCDVCRWPFFPLNMRRIYCGPRCAAKRHHASVAISHARLNRGQSRPREGKK